MAVNTRNVRHKKTKQKKPDAIDRFWELAYNKWGSFTKKKKLNKTFVKNQKNMET